MSLLGCFCFCDQFRSDHLPAGNYWTPVLRIAGSIGPYTWNISAVEVVPICGSGAGDCCQEGGNGTVGCDDEACCEAICAIDPFCCDFSWDGQCANEAQATCAVCKGGGEGPMMCDLNDLCEDAFPINNGEVVDGGTCSCNGDGTGSCGFSEASPDVWYAFTADCNGVAHADTCDSEYYDTVLSVLDTCGGNEIICNDDFCDLQSGVDWAITAGTTYMIRVAGFAADCGDFTLTVDRECDCDPPCDQCSDCIDDVCVDNGECCEGCATCAGDVNCDGMVDPLDSGAILARFRLDPCNEENCRYDVNCDGAIDPLDSGFVLARFGQCNP
ncbi:MAG: hypothetical protein IH988_08735, partial [Planctomycetes bacterium]|nr:hypothetical protein [Planctomycetota bacterium]